MTYPKPCRNCARILTSGGSLFPQFLLLAYIIGASFFIANLAAERDDK